MGSLTPIKSSLTSNTPKTKCVTTKRVTIDADLSLTIIVRTTSIGNGPFKSSIKRLFGYGQ